MFHISHWGLGALFGGVKTTKAAKVPRSDGTGYQNTSITKTVLPNHARWDIGLLGDQQWLQRFTFDD